MADKDYCTKGNGWGRRHHVCVVMLREGVSGVYLPPTPPPLTHTLSLIVVRGDDCCYLV